MTLFITEMSRWTIWRIFKVRGRKDPVLQIQKIYLSQPLLKINVTMYTDIDFIILISKIV